MHQVATHTERAKQRGFTLAELAIVLVIITILAAALLVPISGQIESRQRKQTEVALERIEAALIGFAILYHRLPCPATEKNPAAEDYGKEGNFVVDTDTGDRICDTDEDTDEDEMLPWRTLGLPASDPWGRHFRYRVDLGFSGKSPTNETKTIKASTVYRNKIKVFDHAGKEITVSSYDAPADALKNTVAVALVFSTGPDRTPNGANVSYEKGINAAYEDGEPTKDYDDMVVWIGRPLLIARMAAAGINVSP